MWGSCPKKVEKGPEGAPVPGTATASGSLSDSGSPRPLLPSLSHIRTHPLLQCPLLLCKLHAFKVLSLLSCQLEPRPAERGPCCPRSLRHLWSGGGQFAAHYIDIEIRYEVAGSCTRSQPVVPLDGAGMGPICLPLVRLSGKGRWETLLQCQCRIGVGAWTCAGCRSHVLTVSARCGLCIVYCRAAMEEEPRRADTLSAKQIRDEMERRGLKVFGFQEDNIHVLQKVFDEEWEALKKEYERRWGVMMALGVMMMLECDDDAWA
jgi:hypothetical protein